MEDAYTDERFNRAIVQSTGYQTKSVLCIPFRNAEGMVIGAFQAINKQTVSQTFTERDLKLLTWRLPIRASLWNLPCYAMN